METGRGGFDADIEDGQTLSRMTFAEPLPGFEAGFVGIDANGQMLLVDPCCDGFAHRFSRAGGS